MPTETGPIRIDEDAVHESANDLNNSVEEASEEPDSPSTGGTEKFAAAEEEERARQEKSKRRVAGIANNLRNTANSMDDEDTSGSTSVAQVAPDSPRNNTSSGNSLAQSAKTGRIPAPTTSTGTGGAPAASSTGGSKSSPSISSSTPQAATPSAAMPTPQSTTAAQSIASPSPTPTPAQMQPVAPPRAMQTPPPMQNYMPQYPPPTQQQLYDQNHGAGAQQPSDMISLTPEQMRILAEYLAKKRDVESSGGSIRDVDGTRELNLDGIAGDFQEAVLELCERTVNANIPYAWGGGSLEGPSQGISDGGGPADQCGDYQKEGFDCSGLARFIIYQTTGIEIPRTAAPQYDYCTPTDSPQIGDLGWPPGGNPGHVVICVGDGQVCEAQQSGTNIMFADDRGFVYGYVPGGPNDPSAQ